MTSESSESTESSESSESNVKSTISDGDGGVRVGCGDLPITQPPMFASKSRSNLMFASGISAAVSQDDGDVVGGNPFSFNFSVLTLMSPVEGSLDAEATLVAESFPFS